MRIGSVLRHGAALSIVAFLVHGAWEYAQCSRFFFHGSVPPTALGMLQATVGDVGLTWVAQLTGAVAFRDWWWWSTAARLRSGLLLVGVAIILALAFEAHALRTGRWAYRPEAPLIPGTPISLLPVAQLVLLFPFSFWAAARIEGTPPQDG